MERWGVYSNSDEKELSSKTVAESEKLVSLLVSTIKQFENPFAFNADSKRELQNIATGSVATEEMREDISDAKVRGKESVEKLSVSFWDTLNKLQLKTFSTAEKPLKVIQKKRNTYFPSRLNIKFFRGFLP